MERYIRCNGKLPLQKEKVRVMKRKRNHSLRPLILLTTRCSAIKAEKQETCLSLFLLICLINLGSFLHLCTHDICCQVKPKLCHNKNLMRSTFALGLVWRRRVFFLARLKGRNIFGLLLPSPWLHHLGSWRHPWFLKRAWFPCPCFYPWPPLSLGFDHHLNKVIRKAWKVKNLKFLENSKICKVRKNDSPRAPYIEGKI